MKIARKTLHSDNSVTFVGPRRALIESQVSVIQNYGGALQTYALQCILADFGFLAITNASGTVRPTIRQVLGEIKWAVTGKNLDVRPSTAILRSIHQNLIRFSSHHIHLTPRVLNSSRLPRFVDRFHVELLVAGSDQVWRPRYHDVLRGVFASVSSPNVLRVSYAASFGTPTAQEFEGELHDDFGDALKRFDAVSVREMTGVDICKNEWGIDAEHVLDPTMLLPAAHWSQVASSAAKAESVETPYLLFLRLDRQAGDLDEAIQLAEYLGLELRCFFPPAFYSRAAFSRDPNRFVMPPVEHWLAAIRDADVVITDSYHGSVFSILFNTPFLVLGNSTRGNTRFESLLSTFDLDDSLFVRSPLSSIREIPKIDWSRVADRLRSEKAKSYKYLETALNVDA